MTNEIERSIIMHGVMGEMKCDFKLGNKKNKAKKKNMHYSYNVRIL